MGNQSDVADEVGNISNEIPADSSPSNGSPSVTDSAGNTVQLDGGSSSQNTSVET